MEMDAGRSTGSCPAPLSFPLRMLTHTGRWCRFARYPASDKLFSPTRKIHFMAPRSKFLRPFSHLHRVFMYVRSAFLTLLRSRWASGANFLLAAAVVLFAAAPDFGIEWAKGWWAFGLLCALFLSSQAFGVLIKGSATQAYIDTFSALANIISGLADGTAGNGSGPQILVHPSQAIEALLRRARDFANDTLRLPLGSNLSATLLLPVLDESGQVQGLQATYRAELKFNSVRRIIPLDTPGAGQAFTTGRATGVGDIAEVRERSDGSPWPYRSIAAFPVLAGVREECPTALGVIALDCAVPFIFTQQRVERELAPFVEPIAQLVGLALRLQQENEFERRERAPEGILQEVRDFLVASRTETT